jgi:hypothetical protein
MKEAPGRDRAYRVVVALTFRLLALSLNFRCSRLRFCRKLLPPMRGFLVPVKTQPHTITLPCANADRAGAWYYGQTPHA